MRVWIDTDIGSDVDDALTLGYALRHDAFDVVGVSTVFGDVALRDAIARRLLEIAGAPHVPVVTGLGKPLTERRRGVMFGHEGLGLLEDPRPRMDVSEPEPDRDARVARLADALAETAPDVVLAIGPLTNLGALVAAGVRLPRLAIMGGKVADVMLPGMVASISEWNWFCDPLAVQHVIGAAHATLPRVVPAEVTFRTSLGDADVERLGGGDALARALHALSREWLTAQRERLGSKQPRVALHDPLTLATLVEPTLCRFEPRRLSIDDHGAPQVEQGRPNVEVAVDVDNEALCRHLMATWLERAGGA